VSEPVHVFDTVPPLETVLTYDGQKYRLSAIEPHQRQDGSWTSLLVWVTFCPRCEAPVVVRTSLSMHSLNRRCERHKRPGSRPGGRRRTRPSVSVVLGQTKAGAGALSAESSPVGRVS
jgi:hypothetical protein